MKRPSSASVRTTTTSQSRTTDTYEKDSLSGSDAALSLCLYGQDVKLPNIAAILPAPPSLSDSLFLSDISRYNAGKALRDTERGTVADEDVSTTLEYFLGRFGKAMGREMTAEAYPAVSASAHILSILR